MTKLEEKQANCPYCHNEPMQADLLKKYTDDDMMIVYLETGALVFESMEYKKSEAINYCPICGRKLGEEE